MKALKFKAMNMPAAKPSAKVVSPRFRRALAVVCAALCFLSLDSVAAPSDEQSVDDMLKQLEALDRELQACGADAQCTARVAGEMSSLAEKIAAKAGPAPGPSASAPAPPSARPQAGNGVETVVDVEAAKQRYLACKNDACLGQVSIAIIAEIDRTCPAVGLCPILSRYDNNIALALAVIERDRQREETSDSADDAPPATKAQATAMLADWRARVAGSLPKDALADVRAMVNNAPLSADASQPLAVSIGPDGDQTLSFASQDWAYAVLGAFLMHDGFAAPENALYLDLAFWCFLMAAEMSEEPDHLANVGFFLNIMGEYDDAQRLLQRAKQLAPDHPNVRGNLAFAMFGQGRTKAATQEQAAAIRLDREAAATMAGAGEDDADDSAAVAPPSDYGLAYFRLARRHVVEASRLHAAWAPEMQFALDHALTLDPPPGFPTPPRDVYQRRLAASDKAAAACGAAIPPARTLQDELRNEFLGCQCALAKTQRELSHLNAYAAEQISFAGQYEDEWGPRLAAAQRYWRQAILTSNAQYKETTYQLPAKDQFYQWLLAHIEAVHEFANEWVTEVNQDIRDLNNRAINLTKQCADKEHTLTDYVQYTARRGKIRCAAVTGKTTVIKFIFFKLETFIPTSRSGEMAMRFSAASPFAAAGDETSWGFELEGTMVGDTMKFKGSIGYGPVSAGVWRRSDGGLRRPGEWGAALGFDVIAASGLAAGTEAFVKLEGKYELSETRTDEKKTQSKNAWATKFEILNGYSRKSGGPPAWVQLYPKRPGSPWRPKVSPLSGADPLYEDC